MISGIITAILLVAFIAIAIWAWSGRNRERWRQAAQAPLEDEAPARPACCCDDKGEKKGGKDA